MKTIKFLLFVLTTVTLFTSCKETMETNLATNSLIPEPRMICSTNETFIINKQTKVLYNTNTESVGRLADYLAASISDLGTLNIDTKYLPSSKKKGMIILNLAPGVDVNDEFYKIVISRKQLILSAHTDTGLFRGIQTIIQLLLLENPDVIISQDKISLPTGTIEDYPEYEYRGMMLDVSRHFFSPDIVKKTIDLLALYKINMLHLHLADDQGWRIEIKSWPRLTEIGGSTEVGGGKGGFYTQEEYKDLVLYATNKFITIVPEIDMPGHTNAALASYAELNCNGEATELYTGTRVGFSTLCTSSEITYQFVDDVVREISEMTPGPYFHIGGDESHVTDLPDYIYFINRVREIVKSYGKTMLGWDEISHGNLQKGDVAQYWASSENALRAVGKGASLLISPAQRCYLDMKYNEDTDLGLHWAAYIEVDQAYNWNPLTLVEGIKRTDILGVESPLWAETIETFDDITYLMFPRIIGHAEIGWSPADSLTWDSYKVRLAKHGDLLDKLGVSYYKSKLISW